MVQRVLQQALLSIVHLMVCCWSGAPVTNSEKSRTDLWGGMRTMWRAILASWSYVENPYFSSSDNIFSLFTRPREQY
jgi:hypothetical protein